MSELICQMLGRKNIEGLHMGVEVEVEHADCLDGLSLDHWAIIGDSSLRHEGREFVSSRPLPYATVDAAIDEFEATVADHPNLTVSSRCGVHVHVNVTDLTHEQVSLLLMAYVAVESAMYKFGGKDRYSNIYCPGVTASLEQLGIMKSALSRSGFLLACNDWCKYTGINFRTVITHGTVEFRAHEGTLEAQDLRDWTQALKGLYDYATNLSGKGQLLEDVSKGPKHMARLVFGNLAEEALRDGEYERYFTNNLTNLIDLVGGGEEYVPKPSANRQSTSDSIADIINQINLQLGA